MSDEIWKALQELRSDLESRITKLENVIEPKFMGLTYPMLVFVGMFILCLALVVGLAAGGDNLVDWFDSLFRLVPFADNDEP